MVESVKNDWNTFFFKTRLFKQAFHKGNIQLIFNYFPLHWNVQEYKLPFFLLFCRNAPVGYLV